MEQMNVMNLCTLWLELLDRAGKYAGRYYLARALEKKYGLKYENARKTLAESYKTEAALDAAIQRDLNFFPEKLLEILEAQQACGLPAFNKERWYLDRIMMGLTMLHRNGKKRRDYYIETFGGILNDMTTGLGTAVSLNEVEDSFQESLKRVA